MATEIDTLLLRVASDTSKLTGDMAKVQQAVAKAMQQTERESQRAEKALDNLEKKVSRGLQTAIAALSFSKLTQLGRDGLKTAESLEQASRWLGVGVEKLQAWEQAARAAGLENGQLTAALDKMRGNLADAGADPSSGPAQIFRQIGLNIKDAKGQLLDLETLIPRLQQKLAGLSTADRLIVGKTLFGDKNDDVVRFFAQDLKAIEANALNAGAVWKREFIEPTAQLNRDIEKLESKIGKDLTKAVVDFAPVWKLVLQAVVEVADEVDGLLSRIRVGNFRVGKDVSATQRIGEIDRDLEPLKKTLAQPRGLTERYKRVTQERIKEMEAERSGLTDKANAEAARKQIPAASIEADAMSAGITENKPKPKDKIKLGGENEFEKKIKETRREAQALQNELRFDKAEAEFQKLVAAFEAGSDKMKPTADQTRRFKEALTEIEQGKTALAFKDLTQENERLAAAVSAEASGRKDLMMILEMQYQLEDKLGRKLSADEQQRLETLARRKLQLLDEQERLRGGMEALRGGAERLGGAFEDTLGLALDRTGNRAEKLRSTMSSVVNDILRMMIRLSVINPILNSLGMGGGPGGQGSPTIFGILGNLGGLFGGMATGGKAPARAGGGPFSAGDVMQVGEYGPELVRFGRSGSVTKAGGGTVMLYGSDSATVEIGQLKQGLKQLGIQVKQMNEGFDDRAANAALVRRRESGIYADMFRA